MQRLSALTAFASLCLVCACSGAEGAPLGNGAAGSAGSSVGSTSNVSGGAGALTQGGSTQAAGAGGTASPGAGAIGGAAGFGGSAGGTATAGSAGAGGSGPSAPDVAFCSAALDAAAAQFEGFRAAYTSPTNVARSAQGGVVDMVDLGDWTSGFPGGSYWLLYEYTNDQAFKTSAEAFTAAMESQKNDGSSHDLGFQFMSTFGQGYRIAKTPSYLNVIKTAASTLATRYRPAVGSIESWDHGTWNCPVIIDNMMNLRLLYFVAANGGAANLADIASEHAATAIKNHYRPDNSSFHLVNYDTSTGVVIGKQTVQGLANDSAWSRGQAWGLYGYTESFVATNKAELLAQAQKIAEFLLSHPNMPADKVPYWDYDAPDMATTPRDASAAAVMASALLQLAKLVPEPAASKYQSFALEQLKSLSSPAYAAAKGTNSHFLLMHSTGHLPGNIEIDAAINYADYYYLEALMACRALGAN
jgi:unsaturated chondroitin disaccharide hydrolase